MTFFKQVLIGILIGVILMLCFIKAADARVRYTDAEWAVATAVANTHWPSSPCANRQVITISETPLPDNNIAYATLDGSCHVVVDWQAVRDATPTPVGAPVLCHEIRRTVRHHVIHGMYCPVIVEPTKADYDRMLCAILVHEFGHLALGATYFAASNPSDPAHSPDHTSVMSIDWEAYVPPPFDCRKTFPEPYAPGVTWFLSR